MHTQYWVLSERERAKGFVRPVRQSYRHVGPPGPEHPLRALTPDEERSFNTDNDEPWVAYEEFPAGSHGKGRLLTQKDLDAIGKGCATVTTMGLALAETWAANIHYYGQTYCCGCGTHLPVAEFTWVDGGKDTTERLGT